MSNYSATAALCLSHLFAITNGFSNGPAHWVNNPDACASAADISIFFAAGTGVVQTTAAYDNTAASADPGDPVPECFAESGATPAVNNSLWFVFTGDGGMFHIETVPCTSGGQYISGGDTQIGIYQGTDCSSLQPAACNDDLYPDNDPNTDYRAGLDFQTEAGQTYYMMIDGYASGGVVASGLFCIEIIRITAVSCEQAAAGTFQIANNGFLCKGQNLLNHLSFEASSFVIPSGEPLAGMSWALTAQPIPANTWPGSIPGVISTVLSPHVIPVNLLNNITSSEPLVYYFTPVVVGGASLINPGADPKLHNLDVSAGCYVVGATQVLTLVPVLEPIAGLATATPATFGHNNGAVALTVGGGYPAAANNPDLYQFLWNTGATSASLNNIGPGTYTVTASDPSGCTNSIILTADVTIPAAEHSTVLRLDLSPSPSTGVVVLNLALNVSAEIEIDVLTPFGQVIYHHKAVEISVLKQMIDLRANPDGLYFVRVVADGQTALRKVVLQR
ncbi:MAG: hypothetical protein IT262_00975 [Saprospiraceae bacterium]|nr:hypothetical protein [Saprospiraceae bacterium]